ncbi:hypothetical protein CB1_000692044 [Camelus ferus]|nr:hypothetical protein CB1_000692044 [Camelus ferus]
MEPSSEEPTSTPPFLKFGCMGLALVAPGVTAFVASDGGRILSPERIVLCRISQHTLQTQEDQAAPFLPSDSDADSSKPAQKQDVKPEGRRHDGCTS